MACGCIGIRYACTYDMSIVTYLDFHVFAGTKCRWSYRRLQFPGEYVVVMTNDIKKKNMQN